MSFTASRPRLPVKALALPELTTSARAMPCASRSRHQSTGADAVFDLVSTPATAGAGIEQREQQVDAAGIADAGRGRSRCARPSMAGRCGSTFGAKGETVPI